jgi:hypothetical protein
MFNVAGALFNPGRTGQAFEAIGNAATVAGRDVERDEARAPAIAQMRAQLAGQKYEVGKQSRALGMLGQALGAGPASGDGAMTALQGGNLFDPNFTQKLMGIYPMVAQDAKTGAIVKEMIDQGFKLQTHILEQRKANVSEADIFAKHGPKVLPLLSPEFKRATGLGGGPAAPTTRTAPTSPTVSAVPEPQPAGTVPLGTPVGRTDEEIADQRERGDTPPAPASTVSPTAGTQPPRDDGYYRVDGSFAPFPPNSSIQMQNELVEANEKTIQASKQASVDLGNKYWIAQKDGVYDAGNPQAISRQKNDLNILGKTADRKSVV